MLVSSQISTQPLFSDVLMVHVQDIASGVLSTLCVLVPGCLALVLQLMILVYFYCERNVVMFINVM